MKDLVIQIVLQQQVLESVYTIKRDEMTRYVGRHRFPIWSDRCFCKEFEPTMRMAVDASVPQQAVERHRGASQALQPFR